MKTGDVLYEIDSATYQAAYGNAQAALAKAEANLAAVSTKAARYKELAAIQAVSQQDNDDATAALKQGEAEVAAAKAALESDRINLAHTRITAPITGRIGRSTVTPGALVTASQSNSLATVQQLDPFTWTSRNRVSRCSHSGARWRPVRSPAALTALPRSS